MNKKTKLILMISSFCFIFATCMFSVFAAKNFSFDMAGTIDFIAPGIEAEISAATLSGISKKDGSGQMQTFTVERVDTEAQIAAKSGVQSWKNLGLVFDTAAKGKASISFTIKNKATTATENIMVKLSSNTTDLSPIQATPSADFCIGPNSSHEFTINLSVSDLKTTVSLSGFKLTVALERMLPEQVTSSTDYAKNGFNFETNAATESTEAYASLTTYTGSATAVEIPSVVKDESGNLYTVTQIADGSYSSYAFSSVKSTLASIIFPSTLTKIGNYAFRNCSGLTGDLTIPNSVTTIAFYAFGDCSGLTGDLTIGNSVTTIGNNAFMDCSGLTGELTIPNSVTTIGSYAFYNCSGLTGDLTIGNSVTTIGSCAFMDCSGLTGELTIPNSVTTIGGSAFSRCIGLTGDLTIPNSVTTIGGSAFGGCNLESIVVDSGNANYYSSGNCIISKQDKVLIAGCKNSVIPQDEGILAIGERAFQDCSSLTGDLTIPNSVTTIGIYAFYNCSGLTGELTIGSSVTTIGNSAFRGCSGLTGELTIPNSVTTIEIYAFMDCSKLTGVLTISNSVTTIGSDAFSGCSGLTDLIIPNSVTTIGGSAFRICSGLTGDLTIPNSVTTIGEFAFHYCSKLTSITVEAVTPPTLGGTSCFDYTGTGSIYVPAESVEAYKSAKNWSEYASRITAIPT